MRATIAILVLSVVLPAKAAEFTVDESHTRILFTATHLGFSVMPGIFREFDVKLDFDPVTPTNSALSVTIDAASIDMFDDELNKHLRNADFFDTAHHPTITFVSSSVTMVDATHANVMGSLTLRGRSLPVTLHVTLNKLAPHPMNGKQHVGFAATTTIDRAAFGMTYGIPMVGGEIPLTIALEATIAE
ncbi:MAG: polyisoprenoid-binding protein [Gammaproteobacteria bacterium]|nr:polyisoprenoid-binding protein [Gammaproteobacteria bacterium]